MRIYALNCSTCGAPIEVPARRRLAACPYCDAQLVIVRDDEGAHAEVEHAPAERDKPLWIERDDPRAMELRDRIRELDEQWRTDRMRFMRVKPDGRYSIYSGMDALFTWALVLAAALLALVLTWVMGLPWFVALFGAAPLGVVLWTMEEERTSGRDYRSLRQTYEAKRNALFDELQSLS